MNVVMTGRKLIMECICLLMLVASMSMEVYAAEDNDNQTQLSVMWRQIIWFSMYQSILCALLNQKEQEIHLKYWGMLEIIVMLQSDALCLSLYMEKTY